MLFVAFFIKGIIPDRRSSLFIFFHPYEGAAITGSTRQIVEPFFTNNKRKIYD
jgi:hypothetical protein